MSLRDEILARLNEVGVAAIRDSVESPDRTNARVFLMARRAEADEVIRQMEWARRCNVPIVTHWKMEAVELPPLTLAPEDWTP